MDHAVGTGFNPWSPDTLTLSLSRRARGKGHSRLFGPVVSVTSFKDTQDALKIANDTLYGLGAGVWTRDASTAYRVGRELQAGRVWTNCYHLSYSPKAMGFF